jgi:hypothetical protein
MNKELFGGAREELISDLEKKKKRRKRFSLYA